MIRDLENDDSSTNKNLEAYDNKVSIDKASNTEITSEEANTNADDSILIDDDDLDDDTKRDEIQNQYNQSHQLTEERIRYQDYKQRNMEEFTNDYSISQVVPNGWTTFFNVLSTIFFTLAVFVAICIGICLVFKIQIGIVPTDSMEPTITRGSLIFYKPVEENNISLKELDDQSINTNQILCYNFNGVLYVHRLYDIIQDAETQQKLYVMVGDNEDLHDRVTGNPTISHTITYSQVQGELVLSIQHLGVLVYFIKNNLILTLSIFCVIIFGIMLARNIIERNHAREEINVFITKKADLERQNEEKMLELQKAANKRDFERILQTNYNTTDSSSDPINDKNDFVDIDE